MDVNKKYENALLVALTILFVCVVGLGIYLLRQITLLPIICLPVCCLLSFLVLKNFDTFIEAGTVKHTLFALTIISIICFFGVVVMGHHKDRAIIQGIFIKGKITRIEYEDENDQGGTYFDYRYILKPDNPNSESAVETIDWIILGLGFSFVYVTYRIYNKGFHLYKVKKFRDKFPNWKAEITEDNLKGIE